MANGQVVHSNKKYHFSCPNPNFFSSHRCCRWWRWWWRWWSWRDKKHLLLQLSSWASGSVWDSLGRNGPFVLWDLLRGYFISPPLRFVTLPRDLCDVTWRDTGLPSTLRRYFRLMPVTISSFCLFRDTYWIVLTSWLRLASLLDWKTSFFNLFLCTAWSLSFTQNKTR